ncbi:MAG: hypothetical protein Q9O74_05805 [Planctomycetota bacterium]|nr:hypothetical protein [Planctomycetota bacterium]
MLKRLRNRFPVRRASRAAILAHLAGLSGSLRQTRRGSFLIMVVGTLALIAVITVLYVSIGRADRQTSAAAVRVEDRKNVPEIMRDYLAGIIADDLFDVVYLGERAPNPDNPNQLIPVFRREAWDYPSSAYEVTVPTLLNDVTRTLTVGAGFNANNTAADSRFWFTPTGNYTGTDPWLAASEPTLLNFDGTALTTETVPTDYWRERLDWGQISNVAPDGAFVNLFNLIGNFDATPLEMRRELTLYQISPENARGFQTVYGVNTNSTGSSDTLNTMPAQWAHAQQGAAYPMVEPDISFGPGDRLYLPYQWADADGDGIADSRWYEMVEDRDPADDLIRQLIAPDGEYRYFFATRIVDLSARVNVNTATDSTLAPAIEDPFGFTPAAVDVRRLLTYEDFFADTRVDFDGTPGDGNYGIGPNLHFQQPDYPKLPDPNSSQFYGEYDQFNGYYVGASAYDGLRTFLDLGFAPGPNYQGLSDVDTSGSTDREFATADRFTLNPYFASYQKLDGAPFTPSDYYELFAGNGAHGGTGDLTGGSMGRSGIFRPFSNESLIELLTFNGVNDDRHRSPLEAALGGRAEPGTVTPGGLEERFSPLRDNRSTELERTRVVFDRLAFRFIDEAKAALYTDIRQRLTTDSGARPITATAINASRSGRNFVVDQAELALGTGDLKKTKDNIFTDLSRLYQFYADALAPYSDITESGTSVWDAASRPEYATLFYGYRGPHLAVRTAAHLAANMQDSYDEDSTPTIRTVLLNGSQQFRRNNIIAPGGRNPFYPWQLLDLDQNNSTLAKRLPNLTTTAISGVPDAVNIHGIEAQPFLVEAASFIMYTDTPFSAPNPGDKDWPHDTNGDGLPEQFLPSIDGDPVASNPDCLFEVLAFQLHNPFDETITITGQGNGIGQHYLQYGDTYYKLSRFDRDSGDEDPNGTIEIGPRESRTFYVLSGTTQDILDRINNALPGSATLDTIHAWIDTQLGDTTNAIRVGAFDPATGIVAPPNTGFQPLQSGSDADRQIIRLFRIEKPEFDSANGGKPIQGVNESSTNDITNDTVVDRMRMRDPSGNISKVPLDRHLPPSPGILGEIGGADPGFEPPNVGFSVDNQGLTIVRWGRVSRREDPNGGTAPNTLRGMLPAYCLESKTQASANSRNITDDEGSTNNLVISDFRNNSWTEETLRGALDNQADSTPVKILPTISQDPQDKDEGATEDIGVNLANVDFEELYIEPHLDNSQFDGDSGISTMRIADILLPLGIGPHQIPDPAFNLGDEDVEWTTLSEALAFALYYEDPAAAESVYSGVFVPPVTAADPEILLDRGSLQIAAFVPFYDNDADGVFDVTTDPLDRRWGLGVPVAATLLDRFTTFDRRFGSLVSPTFGQLNINTVSRETARSIPGLSPNEDTGADGSSSRWWWTEPTFNWRSDIATTLVAYRDRLAIFPRAINNTEPNNVLDFRNWWDSDLVSRSTLPMPGFAPGTIDAEIAGDNGRQGTAGVRGLHESPGFRSLGEMLLLRDFGYVTNDLSYASPHDIDRLGFDGDGIDISGVDSINFTTNTPDEMDDDYDEQLALVNAALGSTTVRSDYFAVWFLMHGYREADVILGNNDPLVPSVARRFLMVVDRSNVIEPGDKPRIVLFKEVPL